MNLIQAIEIFAMVTGVAYIVLEILQKNAMWVVGILTGASCAYSFAVQHSWGMTALNVYYVVMSVVGIIQWRKDGAKAGEGVIHLEKLPRKTALWSAVAFVAGSLALTALFRVLGVVAALRGIGPDILKFHASLPQVLHQLLLEGKSAVIGSDDQHIRFSFIHPAGQNPVFFL